MADLNTTYMGLELKNPILPSASPISKNLDEVKKLEDHGAPGVVFYSLFEEQVALETGEFSELLTKGTLSLAEANVYFPHKFEYARDPDDYVEHIRKAKESIDIPVIASMNGTSVGGWLDYAEKIQQAGADGLEMNVYFIPASDTLFGLDIETLYLDILNAIKDKITIPVAVKLSPFFSALPNFAARLEAAGADALVLFNRFYQPDIDVERREVSPRLLLSRSEDLLLPLRWIAILFGQVECSLALTSGVHTAQDVLKAILAGADVANVCSVLLREGVERIQSLISGTKELMQKLEIPSLTEVRGELSLESYVEPTAFERSSYIKMLQSFGRI